MKTYIGISAFLIALFIAGAISSWILHVDIRGAIIASVFAIIMSIAIVLDVRDKLKKPKDKRFIAD